MNNTEPNPPPPFLATPKLNKCAFLDSLKETESSVGKATIKLISARDFQTFKVS